MPTESLVQRAFSGGELSPALYARADQTKYLTGLRTCRNLIVQRDGGVTKRPGFKYVAEVKDSADATRLLRFVFEGADQTYLIEAGDLYLRFYWHGAPVTVSGVTAWNSGTTYVIGDLASRLGVNYYCILGHSNQQPPNATYWYALTGDIYEIPTPYLTADVGRLRAEAQSADVLTITHPTYAPRELQRHGHTTWKLVTVETEPSLDPPASPAGVAGAAGSFTYRYVITAAKELTFEESHASDVATIASCDVPTTAAPNTLSWTAVAGAEEYYVYADPYGNGIYGFIGTAATNAFNDVGLVPDFTITPPIAVDLFDSAGEYPAVAAYYQQRRIFARSNDQPEHVWGSQVGAYSNFSISTPLQDDDAVTFVIAGNHLNPVAHLVVLKRLLVLTDEGEWIIRGDEQGVLRPTAINADQEAENGADHRVGPVVIGNSVLYVQALGTKIRELNFDQQQGGFAGTDLTIFASHLFDGYTIVDLAFQKEPHSVLWAVRDDGVLLGLTYIREHDVWAWHRHDTGASGEVESIAVLPDSTAKQHVLYALIKRTINGATQRYIERLMPIWNEATDDIEDAFYVDSGLTYDGAAATVISGLDHLEGEVVAVLGNGVVVYDGDPDGDDAADFTVASGSITLPAARSVVQVGLAIRYPQMETLDLDVQGTNLRDRQKRVQSLTAIVKGSAHGMRVGPDEDNLVAERAAPWETSTAIVTGQQEVLLTAGFNEHGRVVLRHVEPLPWTVLGIIPNVEVGG